MFNPNLHKTIRESSLIDWGKITKIEVAMYVTKNSLWHFGLRLITTGSSIQW